MKKVIAFLFSVFLIISLSSKFCYAQESVEGNCFIQLDGIEGNCQDAQHKRWIEIVDYRINTGTDDEGNEITTGITFTNRIDSTAVKIFDYYNKERFIRYAKLELTEVQHGKRELLASAEFEKIRIDNFELILLDDGSVAERVTLVSQKASAEDFELLSPRGSTFGAGSIVLICAGAVVITGFGVLLFVLRKRKMKTEMNSDRKQIKGGEDL